MDCNKTDAIGTADPLVAELSSSSKSQDCRITGVGRGLSLSVFQPPPQASHKKHHCPPGPRGLKWATQTTCFRKQRPKSSLPTLLPVLISLPAVTQRNSFFSPSKTPPLSLLCC